MVSAAPLSTAVPSTTPPHHPPSTAQLGFLSFLLIASLHIVVPHEFPHLSFPPSPSFTQRASLIFGDPWQQNTLFSSPLANPVTPAVNLLLSSGPDLSQIHSIRFSFHHPPPPRASSPKLPCSPVRIP
ncbi:unnamed protein product [Sphenostylis stenocarpa]|uniref:Uncharacterized protein n=1 Tax=Sphenostylis stenocarpa TaxID=92480 RepID=A0AA86S9K3_9FABA|nr:unnamed protein product [Sphenostylis stenocarpa]